MKTDRDIDKRIEQMCQRLERGERKHVVKQWVNRLGNLKGVAVGWGIGTMRIGQVQDDWGN